MKFFRVIIFILFFQGVFDFKRVGKDNLHDLQKKYDELKKKRIKLSTELNQKSQDWMKRYYEVKMIEKENEILRNLSLIDKLNVYFNSQGISSKEFVELKKLLDDVKKNTDIIFKQAELFEINTEDNEMGYIIQNIREQIDHAEHAVEHEVKGTLQITTDSAFFNILSYYFYLKDFGQFIRTKLPSENQYQVLMDISESNFYDSFIKKGKSSQLFLENASRHIYCQLKYGMNPTPELHQGFLRSQIEADTPPPDNFC